MSPILVLDTATLLDLERGGLLQAVFRLEREFVAPELSLEYELRDAGLASYLRQLGLHATDLDGQELAAARALARPEGPLSLYECASLVCARRALHVLVSDGPQLRAAAEQDGRACLTLVGLLKLVDESALASPSVLVPGVLKIGAGKPKRLQDDELQTCLAEWAQRSTQAVVSLEDK